MARRDFKDNKELEAYTKEHGPGSAAEYLRLRRQELEAEAQQAKEKQAEESYIESFVANGGNRSDAKAAYQASRNAFAAKAASDADSVAVAAQRSRISSAL